MNGLKGCGILSHNKLKICSTPNKCEHPISTTFWITIILNGAITRTFDSIAASNQAIYDLNLKKIKYGCPYPYLEGHAYHQSQGVVCWATYGCPNSVLAVTLVQQSRPFIAQITNS